MNESRVNVLRHGDCVQLEMPETDPATGARLVMQLNNLQVAALVKNLEQDKASNLPIPPTAHDIELGKRRAGSTCRKLAVIANPPGSRRFYIYREEADMTRLISELKDSAAHMNRPTRQESPSSKA